MEARSSEADPALGQLISAVVSRAGVQRIAPSHTVPFEALVRAVVYQSVSGKSAATIFARLKQAITGTLSPARILGLPQSTLTAAGLSTSKSTTIHRLAEWFEANSTIARQLPDLTYEGVISALIGIPGIGAWTVSVLLIF